MMKFKKLNISLSYLVIPILLLSFFTLIGCTPSPSQVSTSQGGIGLSGTVYTGEEKDHRVSYITSDPIGESLPISGTLFLNSDLPYPETYAVIALVNYQQQSTTINEETRLYHIIPADTRATVGIDFRLEIPNTQGRYKIWWLFFSKAGQHRLDQPFRMSTQVHGLPWDIVIDEGTFPTLSFDHNPLWVERTSTELGGMEITNEVNQLNLWLTDTTKIGEPLDYYIHLGNTQTQSVQYALVSFFDWEQIVLSPEHGEVIWLDMQTERWLTIPTTAPISTLPKVYELQTIAFPNPYAPEGTPEVQGQLVRRLLGPSTIDSFRVGILVDME